MTSATHVMAAAPAAGAPGDIQGNTQAIIRLVKEAVCKQVRLLVLPELCLSGGSMFSMMRHRIFHDAIRKATMEIAHECKNMLCVFGLPLQEQGRLYNALAVVSDGTFAGFVIKQHLSKEDKTTFSTGCPDKVHWFGQSFPANHIGQFSYPGQNAQSVQVRFFHDLLPPFPPLQADQVLAISAREPATAGVESGFPSLLTKAYAKCGTLVFANAGANESSTDLVYSGFSFVSVQGHVAAKAAPFSQQSALADISLSPPVSSPLKTTPVIMDSRMPYAPADEQQRTVWCRDCITIAAQGLTTRMKRINVQSVTLGISGGLDSAIALLIVKKAFDILQINPNGIYAYSLPAMGSSDRTRNNALLLMEALGISPREIDLKPSLNRHFLDIGHPAEQLDVVYENAQARERTQVLMNLANQVGGIMVGSGDLSELALGFTTFGGDHISMYGVNAGLYKTAIRLILQQAAHDTSNKSLRRVLEDILVTPVSPELLPPKEGQIMQQTEQILGSYLLNDFFLHHFLKGEQDPLDIATMASHAFQDQVTPEEIVQKLRAFLHRFFASQFKRNCLPDGPQVLGVSLSPRGGFSLPSDASASVWLQALDQADA